MSSDYPLEATVFLPFTTRAFATGIPTVLAGTPAIDIYEDAGTTPVITGETLVVSLNSVVGFNMITVTATAATGFEAGKSYTAIIEAGTVASVSVVGEVVGHFTIQRSPVNWANVTAPTTAVDLSGTDIQLVDTTTTNTDMRGTDSALLAANINLASGVVESNLLQMGGVVQSGTDLKDFADAGYDPVTNKVQGVVLVDTTTVNTDMRGTDGVDTATMRGTDSALLAASAPTNFGDLAITITTGLVSVGTNNDKTGYSISGTITTLDGLNNFAPGSDAVANVTLVATTTTNTDMRGTDSAFLAASSPTNFSALGISAGGAIDDVTLVATTTTNTDQRGTDSAALASVLGTPVGADISADIAAVKADTVIPEKNVAFSNVYALMVDSTDHVTPKTGLTLTVQRSLDGAAFGAATGTAAEISNGMYQFDATAADMNGDTITFRFSGTAADDTFLTIVTR